MKGGKDKMSEKNGLGLGSGLGELSLRVAAGPIAEYTGMIAGVAWSGL